LSNPITTSGLKGGDVATDHHSGETTQEWVEAHDVAVGAAVPSSDKLTTTWTSAGGPQSTETTRWPDETDEHFVKRHEAGYTDAMVAQPPIP
jgi:hypothetical protein